LNTARNRVKANLVVHSYFAAGDANVGIGPSSVIGGGTRSKPISTGTFRRFMAPAPVRERMSRASHDRFDVCPFDEAPLCPPLTDAGSHADLCVPRPATCSLRSDRRGFSRRSLSIQCRRRRSVSEVLGGSEASRGIGDTLTQPAMPQSRAKSMSAFIAPSNLLLGTPPASMLTMPGLVARLPIRYPHNLPLEAKLVADLFGENDPGGAGQVY
jgi:hypothetical protein